MKAKDLAKKLMEQPEAEVIYSYNAGCEECNYDGIANHNDVYSVNFMGPGSSSYPDAAGKWVIS